MINALLPGEAEVHHLTFGTLEGARPIRSGGARHRQLPVSAAARRRRARDRLAGKAAIGIFGTQYRELIPRAALDRLIDRLDTWFARNEDDVLMYGRGRQCRPSRRLADRPVPDGPGRIDEPLLIDDDTGREMRSTAPSRRSSSTARCIRHGPRRRCCARALPPSCWLCRAAGDGRCPASSPAGSAAC